MRGYYTLLSILVSWWTHAVVCAQPNTLQEMKGDVIDLYDNRPVNDVSIRNIYTDEIAGSEHNGHFSIGVQTGQLVEFRKEGYKVLRVRVPQGKLPSYFKVMMQRMGTGVTDYMNARGAAPDYKTDSAKYYALYKEALEVPRLSGLDAIQHPFSALSKKNKQIWAFQEEYEFYQQQKFIDYTFNPKLVQNITGFGGDSLQKYMELFRPTYDQLRNMNEYTYYNYIKVTSTAFRKRGIRSKMQPSRSAD
jgi:hypothetical protein